MSARRRAADFARALDTGERGEHADVVDALGAARVALLARTTPTPQFRERARGRLLSVVDVQGVGGPEPATSPATPRRRWLRPLAAVCASVLVVCAALVGISVASRHALPGDLLYGAKRTTEALELHRTSRPLDQGVARLHLAEKRLAEVRALAARDQGSALGPAATGTALASGGSSAALIRATLRDMDELTTTGSAQVEQVAAQTGNPVPLQVLQAWSDMQAGHLRAAAAVVPVEDRDRLAASLTLVDSLHARTGQLLAGH